MLLIVGGVAAACNREPQIDAPPPAVVADDSAAVTGLPASVVESEIRYDLEPALVALEKSVPRTFGDIATKLPVKNNSRAHFSFEAKRTPFYISVEGQEVTVSSVIEYEGRGYYKPFIGPEVSAACGTGSVDRPRARIRMQSTLGLRENWTLRARSRLTRVVPYSEDARDKCTVTLFHIDVTDKVMAATRGHLEKQLRTLDLALANVNTREHFEKWWRAVSRPIRLADSVYFTINPSGVQLAGIDVDSGYAVAKLRLTTAPRIETGFRPNDFDLFTDLPPLKSGGELTGQGLRVTLEAEFSYEVASNLLRKNLVGKKIEVGSQSLLIKDLFLSGIGGGRVALGVKFGGSARGTIYLIGTPLYDKSLDQLVVPDLSYDLNTSSLLVSGLAFLGSDQILQFLRERARFPVEGHLDRLRELAVKGMNRDLTEGVSLVASLDKVENVKVRATVQALLVRADAGGDIHMEIDRPLKAKKLSLAK
ncbi:MAG: DUF4403 family protein [Gemmatimonadaceae bacterium]